MYIRIEAVITLGVVVLVVAVILHLTP